MNMDSHISKQNRRKKFSDMSGKYSRSIIRRSITKKNVLLRRKTTANSSNPGNNLLEGESTYETRRKTIANSSKPRNDLLEGESAYENDLSSTADTVNEVVQSIGGSKICSFLPNATSEPLALSNENEQIIERLNTELRNWAIQGNISHHNFNKLLLISRKRRDPEQFKNLPMDCRTLLKSSKHNEIINSGKGQYYHFGVSKGILHTLERHHLIIEKTINLDINIDGLPIAKSSGSQFWTILGSISRSSEPFVIGVWHVYQHPESPNELLEDFVEECLMLKNGGIRYEEKVLDFNLSKIICDAPAKSFVLGLKGHNSYFGCTKCTVEGTYKNNRMCFINDNCPLRTDEKFRSGDYGVEYHKYPSPLQKLNLDLVNCVPLDYMHLVCLGVMKRLLQFWYRGNQEIRMNPVDLNKANTTLQTFRKFLSSSDFARIPRSISEIDS